MGEAGGMGDIVTGGFEDETAESGGEGKGFRKVCLVGEEGSESRIGIVWEKKGFWIA